MTDIPLAPPRPAGALCRLMRRKLALLGLVLIALVVLGALLAPWIAPYAAEEQLFDGLTPKAPLPPNETFLFGTDLSWAATCSAGCFTARRPRW